MIFIELSFKIKCSTPSLLEFKSSARNLCFTAIKTPPPPLLIADVRSLLKMLYPVSPSSESLIRSLKRVSVIINISGIINCEKKCVLIISNFVLSPPGLQ